MYVENIFGLYEGKNDRTAHAHNVGGMHEQSYLYSKSLHG